MSASIINGIGARLECVFARRKFKAIYRFPKLSSALPGGRKEKNLTESMWKKGFLFFKNSKFISLKTFALCCFGSFSGIYEAR